MSGPVRVATFNILGASHTENGRRGFATYETRMVQTIRLIEQPRVRHRRVPGVPDPPARDVRPAYRRRLGRLPGPRGGTAPGAELDRLAHAEWRIVEKQLYTIPYFRGRLVEQPYVKLRNADGVEVWVINTHNPADSKGPAQRYRDGPWPSRPSWPTS